MFTYEQFDRNFAIFYIYLKNKSKVQKENNIIKYERKKKGNVSVMKGETITVYWLQASIFHGKAR